MRNTLIVLGIILGISVILNIAQFALLIKSGNDLLAEKNISQMRKDLFFYNEEKFKQLENRNLEISSESAKYKDKYIYCQLLLDTCNLNPRIYENIPRI